MPPLIETVAQKVETERDGFRGEMANAGCTCIHLCPQTQSCRPSEPPSRLLRSRRAPALARPSNEDPGKAPSRSASSDLWQPPPWRAACLESQAPGSANPVGTVRDRGS